MAESTRPQETGAQSGVQQQQQQRRWTKAHEYVYLSIKALMTGLPDNYEEATVEQVQEVVDGLRRLEEDVARRRARLP